MNKHKQTKGTPFAKRFPRSIVTGVLLAMAILTIGVVAGLSKQKFTTQEAVKQGSAPLVSAAKANLTGSQQVNQTPQAKSPTAEEAQMLATALKELANQSMAGLRQVKQPDGTVSMDLQGHFQNVAIAKRNEDGSISQSCIDNPIAGAAFFGIDPTLVGAKTGATAANASPAIK